ncbi:MAG: GIY-YIG nuclease family protein [Saprospiraceae bacterium]|nr:GIY-YIG nuclease family protein [Saprospiraceae bacterium]
MKPGFVYIMSNKNRTTLYVGVTNNIQRRALEHKSGTGSGFTGRYNLFNLLYFEKIDDIQIARKREKQLKNWHRDWKLNLIKEENPEMKDLAEGWFTEDEIRNAKGRYLK